MALDPVAFARELHQAGWEPPVDPYALAAQLAIPVQLRELEGYVSGILVAKRDGRAVVVLNQHHAPPRRSVMLAYFLGHYLLDPGEALQVVASAPFHIATEPLLPPAEQAAVRFAVELLLPERAMRAAVARPFDAWDEKKVRAAALQLGVPLVLFTARAAQLGLVTAWP